MIRYTKCSDGLWLVTRDGVALVGELASMRAAQLAGMEHAEEGEKVCAGRLGDLPRRYVEVKRGDEWVRLAGGFSQVRRGDVCRTYEPDGTVIDEAFVAASDAVAVGDGTWGFDGTNEELEASPALVPALEPEEILSRTVAEARECLETGGWDSDLGAIEAAEKAGKNRVGVLRAIAGRRAHAE